MTISLNGLMLNKHGFIIQVKMISKRLPEKIIKKINKQIYYFLDHKIYNKL